MNSSFGRLAMLGTACMLALLSPAQGAILNVEAAGSTATGTAVVGGTFIVQQNFVQPAGTGVYDPFLRIDGPANGTSESGYNTSVSPFPLDDLGPLNFTHALLLSAVPIVTINGVAYREFLLDVNQTESDPVLGNISLNQVQLFQSAADVGNSGFTFAAGTTAPVIQFPNATQVFQMSNGTVNEVLINSSHGSGESDMALYVRNDLFNPAVAFVTLFSQFGTPPGSIQSDDGFEEWATHNPNNPIPEPFSIVIWTLLGLGWTGLAVVRRRSVLRGSHPQWSEESRSSIHAMIEQGQIH